MNQSSSPPSLADLAALNAELAALVRARIPLEPELRRLAHQLPGTSGALAERLAARMEQGRDLAQALADEGDALPEVYRAAVAAGLASGEPAAVLEDLANSATRLSAVRNRTGVAMLYPIAVVLLASWLLGLVLLANSSSFTWIAPKTLAPYQQWIESPIVRWMLFVIIPVLAILIPLVWWIRTQNAGSKALSHGSWLNWIPGVGRLHTLGSAATLAEVLRLLIAHGVPLDRALRTAAGAIGHTGYRRAALELANHCESGGTLSTPLGAPAVPALIQLPSLVHTSLLQSENREMLTAALARAARSYKSRADSVGLAINDLIPVIMTAGVAGTIVAVYAIGLMWPYVTMLYSLAEPTWR